MDAQPHDLKDELLRSDHEFHELANQHHELDDRLHQLTAKRKPGGWLWGRNRIDGRVKVVLSPGMVSAVIGLFV